MSLEAIYSGQVGGAGSVTSLPSYGNPPVFERDPTIRQLEHDVFQQMQSVLPSESVAIEVPKIEIGVVSFEDALRELAAMNK